MTASDVFATGVWSARGGKPTLGVDIYTVCADCHKTYLIDNTAVAPR